MTRRPDSGQEAVWDFRGLDLQTVVQKKDLGLLGTAVYPVAPWTPCLVGWGTAAEGGNGTFQSLGAEKGNPSCQVYKYLE